MRIFIDANIIVDVLLKRREFYEDASNVLSICEKHKSALAPHTISNIFFITRKDYTARERKHTLLKILEYIDIIPTGKYQIVQALKNDDIDDFEDALQLECAREFNADFIVSRDADGFANSDVEVITPYEFVKKFGDFSAK
jgi:predicted nucleic acid-binding protein